VFTPSNAAPTRRAESHAEQATIVGGFSRVGSMARRATQPWPQPPRLDGQVVVVTSASSGIGRAAALALGGLGAEVGRDRHRTEAVAGAIRLAGGRAEGALLEVADGAAVDAFADRFASRHDRLDGLVHGAGALLADYAVSAEGFELTVETHVLGSYRLTWRLVPQLRPTGRSTILTVSSGGMYTERFDLNRLEVYPAHYDGVRAHARAKRAHVVLAREWARRWSAWGVASYAMHPGWVDTPGLASGLPSFTRLGPLLRRPEEGADTAVWPAAGAARPPSAPGLPTSLSVEDGFWRDRRLRGEYYLPWTRSRDGHEEEGRRLWDRCATSHRARE
jgi:NAD(P)-dependent dehydrogenase (short-subunit alcohol dehydrogenase family)